MIRKKIEFLDENNCCSLLLIKLWTKKTYFNSLRSKECCDCMENWRNRTNVFVSANTALILCVEFLDVRWMRVRLRMYLCVCECVGVSFCTKNDGNRYWRNGTVRKCLLLFNLSWHSRFALFLVHFGMYKIPTKQRENQREPERTRERKSEREREREPVALARHSLEISFIHRLYMCIFNRRRYFLETVKAHFQ